MSFFDIDVADLEAAEPVIFPAKVPVEFTVTSLKELPKYGSVQIMCKVNTGEHAGKFYEMSVGGGDSAKAKANKAKFLLAFWSKEDLVNGKASLDTLMGTTFQARPDSPWKSEKSGKTYQNFDGYMKLAQQEAAPTNLPF